MNDILLIAGIVLALVSAVAFQVRKSIVGCPYENLTDHDLKLLCKILHIDICESTNREEMIKMIERHPKA
jgi:hypothetical protein